ncbi:Ig-like domain-containing protein, partial [Acholeplasma laidlawii]|uniref:Ig-like domain-containing protein n=1 Tax=Acholeplasma laidlawii TaxID=2148 RepID=UPI0018C210F7
LVEIEFEIKKADINDITIEISNSLIEVIHNNNNKTWSLEDVNSNIVLKFNGQTISDSEVDILHYNFTNLSQSITSLDLTNGASTFIVRSSIKAIESSNFEGIYEEEIDHTDITIKLKSVLYNNIWYTIEDALAVARSGTVVVAFNTAFASSEVAQEVYGGNTQDVKMGVTLLLPANSSHETSRIKGGTSGRINRTQGPFIKLSMEDVVLDVFGELIVNAKIGYSQPQSGHVVGSEYSELELIGNAIINIRASATLSVLGFIHGGHIFAEENSKVYETMIINNFPGGNVARVTYEDVLPFNQYGLNHIISTIEFASGVDYYGVAYTSIEGFNEFIDVKVIGASTDYMLQLLSGKVTKYFSESSGTIELELNNAEVSFNNIEVPIKYVNIITVNINMSTKDKYLPLPGNFSVKVLNNSNMVVNSVIALLPGSSIYVDNSSIVTLGKNGAVFTTLEGDYQYNNSAGHYGYGSSNSTLKSTYRLEPNIMYGPNDSSQVIVNGTIIVQGKISGTFRTNENAKVILMPSSTNQITIKELISITGSGLSVSAQKIDKTYKLLDAQENDISNLPKGIYTVSDGGNTWTLDNSEALIYFHLNGGTGVPNELHIDLFNFDPNQSIYIPEHDSKVFSGWFVDEELTIPYVNLATFEDELHLYAKYLSENDINIMLESNKESQTGAGDIIFTATVKDVGGNSIANLKVNFMEGTTLKGSGITNQFGQVAHTYKATNDNKTIKLVASLDKYPDTKDEKSVKVTKSSSSSPFLYSVDSAGNLHFEHEPISLSMLKVLESSTYGTLRLLEDIDGKYYIQVIEEGTSITMLNGANLFYFDYEENNEIIDFFIDVYGNPYSIKERITPNTFTDHKGISYLDQVLAKDGNYATLVENSQDLLAYYYMTFNRPNTNNAKFMISLQDNSISNGKNTTEIYSQLLSSFNAHRNLWWFDQILMNNSDDAQVVKNLFDSLLVNVEVWDGNKWIYKGSIQRGSYLLEEFLLVLDLEGINTEELNVRLQLPGKAHYIIDSVAVDYSENIEFSYGAMTLESAMLNNGLNVYSLVVNDSDNQYVSLSYKDAVELAFTAPELQEGFTRRFGVEVSGYIYPSETTIYDDLEELMIGKTFEEIKQIIIDSGRQDLIDDIPLVEEFYYTVLHIGSQDLEIILDILFSDNNPPGEDD